ncbi:GntR family transcriptional regulator [Nocardiopsis ganjiahuensis]|uniref:GntR family transcriptional regulator n=1 Tax=Nocardiopsis ganjiahuensis TaxID=239984 RepID=UPI0003463404|nr:GntR family transcriptional regulator [Nocardiopsis ganjiahuensis]
MSEPSGRELPPYARVVASIRERITEGELEPGDRVPSTREIIREWGVAMATATKALSALQQEGLVEAVRGVGTVVRGSPQPEAAVGTAPEPAPVGRPERAVPTAEPEPVRPRTAGGGGHRPASESALTREAIVRAAITIADAEGIDGLSMRRVSTELRVSTMALYRHIASKSELLTAMIDRIYLNSDLPEHPPEEWREALGLAVLWEWGVYRQHPWAVRLTMMSGPVASPGLMGNAEWMMGVVTAQGHSSDRALTVVTILSAYTSGMALQGMQVAVDENEAALDYEQWWRAKGEKFLQYAAEGRYPVMFGVTGPPDVDRVFAVGLERLLDGLTPLIAPPDQGADAQDR